MKKQTIKLNESQLRNIIKESIKKVLKEGMESDRITLRDFLNKKTTLRDLMTHLYDNDETCERVLSYLMDDTFIHEHGWERVFHEGYGDGVYSPQEGIVATFDCDGLPEYHNFQLFRYNPQVWKSTENGGLDKIYAGDNGGEFDVEPIDESIKKAIRKYLH